MKSYSRLEHSDPAIGKLVVVDWIIGTVCNYACSYCPEGLHNGKYPFPKIDDIKQFSDQVVSHFKKKKVHFQITGGEVTLYPKLLDFCDHVRLLGASVGILSNGSRSVDWWNKAAPLLDQVGLSFHSESADISHFVEVIKILNRTASVHVSLMMKPDRFEYCLEAAKEFAKQTDLSLSFEPLLINFGDQLYGYTKKQKEFFRSDKFDIIGNIKSTRETKKCRGAMDMVDDKGNRETVSSNFFLSEGRANWKGWQCHIGKEQFVVQPNGVISRGWCGVGGPIGHISDKKLNLPDKPVLCIKEFCFCNFDIMSTKVSPKTRFKGSRAQGLTKV